MPAEARAEAGGSQQSVRAEAVAGERAAAVRAVAARAVAERVAAAAGLRPVDRVVAMAAAGMEEETALEEETVEVGKVATRVARRALGAAKVASF